MSRNNQSEEKKDEYINYLDPFLGRFAKSYADKPWGKPRTQAIMLFVLALGLGVGSMFLALPQFVWIILGVIMGIALFVPLYFMFTRYAEVKQENDPEYVSLKSRLLPMSRLRFGAVTFVSLIVLSAFALQSIPAAGGVIIVASSLGFYAFMQRTPEEFETYMAGEEVDPVAERKLNDEIEKDQEEVDAMMDQFAKYSGNLPEEDVKLLLKNIKIRQAKIDSKLQNRE